jgi:hypothetical protein
VGFSRAERFKRVEKRRVHANFASFESGAGFGRLRTLGINDPHLKLKVDPNPAVRGRKVLFVLNAPMDADKVTGVLEIFTIPSFQFKRDPKMKLDLK